MQEVLIKKENLLGSERLGALKDTGGKKKEKKAIFTLLGGYTERRINIV